MAGTRFVRNNWYVAGFSRDIGYRLAQRWILGEPVLLYRTEQGQAAAMSDRCTHRSYPLSRGKLIGDRVECGYHGFVFDPGGKCVEIPGQPRIPAKADVRAYPLVERFGLVWIWMGKAGLADEALIPDCPWFAHSEFNTVSGVVEINCRYELLIDNIMDLSHLSYTHSSLLGNRYIAETPVQIEILPNLLRTTRHYNRVEVAPFYARLGLKNPVNRWQISEFTPPNFLVVHSGNESCDDPTQRYEYKALNLITPATESMTRYYWGAAYRHPIDFETMHAGIESVVQEDIGVLEAQEVMVATDESGVAEVSAARDGGVIQARRMIEELLQAEAAGRNITAQDRRQMSEKLARELSAT